MNNKENSIKLMNIIRLTDGICDSMLSRTVEGILDTAQTGLALSIVEGSSAPDIVSQGLAAREWMLHNYSVLAGALDLLNSNLHELSDSIEG